MVFGPADTVRYLLVRAIDDAVDDDGTNVFGESVLLDISSPSSGSGVVVGDGKERTTVVFLDNDGGSPPSIPRFSAATPGDGHVVLSWEKGLPPGGDPTSFELTVRNLVTFGKSWTLLNIPGTTRSLTIGADLPGIGEALLNGQVHRFTLQAKNDSGVSIRASAVATPNVMPPATVGLKWSEDDYTATEGGGAEMLLLLDKALDRDVTVSMWTVYEGTTSPADVRLPDPLSITIPANTTRGSMTVGAVDDDLPESEEAIQVGFRELPEGVAFDDTNARPTTRLRLTDNDPPLTASFEHSSYEVREGDSVDVTLLLNETNPGVLGTLNLLREDIKASSGDLIGVPPQVTFLPDVTRLTFTLEAPDDDFDDDGESVRIDLVGPYPTATRAAAPSTTEITIIDNDDPVEVSFDKPSYTVAEGSSVNVRVRLSRAPGVTEEVTLLSGPAGGADTEDYLGVPDSLTFGPQQTEAVFAVTAVTDTEAETGERLDMLLLPTSTTVVHGTPRLAVVNLTDTALTPVTVAYEYASYTVQEGGEVEVAVVLDQEPGRSVVVPLAHDGEGGASAGDYDSAAIPDSVTFAAAETRKTFTVSATADTDTTETGERIRFTIPDPASLPPGVTVGTPPAATVHLTETPPAAVSYEQDSYTVQEGAEVAVAVVLDRAPGRSVTVDLTRANQGTTTDADYAGVPASVTFGATDTRVAFTVSAVQDGVFEAGESVLLGFAALPAGLNAGAAPETTVHLTEESALAVRVGYEQNSYNVQENGATAEVAVILDRAPGRSVAVTLTRTNQNGASDADYSGVPASVTFGPTETRKTFTVSAGIDARDPGESVLLGFAAALPADVTVGTWPTTQVYLRDIAFFDRISTVRFEPDRYEVQENGTSASVTVQISRVTSAVTVPLAAFNQNGATDADYSGVPSNLTFEPNTPLRRTFTVTANVDTDTPELGESVRLVFDNLPSGVSAAEPSAATVDLLDTITRQVRVRFERDSYTAREGGPPAQVAVVLDQAPGRAITVPLTATNHGSANDADYSGVPAHVTFGPTATRATFTVNAPPDFMDEGGESVRLAFGTLPHGVLAGTPPAATVHLIDAATTGVQVRFERDSHTAQEGGPDAEVALLLDRAPGREIQVRVAVTPEGGAEDADYSGLPTTVTFGAGDTRATFAVHATPDTEPETGELLRMSFSMLPAGVSAGTPEEAVLHLTDATLTAVAVSYARYSNSAHERGLGAAVKVVLDRQPGRALTVPLTAANQGTTTDADYSGVPASVTFAATETSTTFTVKAVADTVWDPGESVRLGFTMLPPGVSPGLRPNSTVHLVDSATRQVSVSFVRDSYTTTEGEAGVQVGVMLNEPGDRPIVVPLLKTNQGGATDADYTKAPVTIPDHVAFAATEALHTFTITAHDDFAIEDGESVRFRLGALPAGVDYGTRRQATVALTEPAEVPVRVRFARDSATAREGDPTGATVTVLLDRQPGREVVVPLTRTNQGGASNSDYNHAALPASVTFGATETSKSFTVIATADTETETGEWVQFRTGDLPSGVTLGTPETMTVHLTDASTQALQVSFEHDRYAAAEGDTATVAVQLDRTPDRAVEVALAITPGAGVTSADYSGIPASVSFVAGGATSRSFTVSAVADDVDEELESLRLDLSMLPAGVSPGTHPATTVYLTDADMPPVRVSFEQDSYTARQGDLTTLPQPAEVAVVLDQAPGRTVIVPLTRMDVGTTTSADYDGVPASVTFGPTQTRSTFRVSAEPSARDGDALTLGFGALPATVMSERYENTRVDLAGPSLQFASVRFEHDSYTAREGGPNAVVAAVLEPGRVLRTIDVRLTTTARGASETDYSGVPETIRFSLNRPRVTFTVTATQDDEDEGDEALDIAFARLPPAFRGVPRRRPPST